jgi:putative toxin-antitoxin system antitoxin component (TIGR02293 family)
MAQDEARRRLLEAAIGYFGSKEAALQWMNSPHRGLEGMTPQDVLDTHPGVEQIMDLISQLEEGDSS